MAKRLGLMILWTVHELFPHQADWVERAGYRIVAREADGIIFHSRCAADEGRRAYRLKGRVVLMPVGNYSQVYPSPRDGSLIRQSLGLRSEGAVICAIGHMRKHKGLELAVNATVRLAGRVQLVLAGPGYAETNVEVLRETLEGRSLGRILPRKISDQELADIMSISEAVLLPYRVTTTSSALLTACSLGRGAICSDLPFFRELLQAEPQAGRLFATGNEAALADAIQDYLGVPADVRKQAALRLADRYTWDRCIVPVAALLADWRKGAVEK